jgi:hypothetical protein
LGADKPNNYIRITFQGLSPFVVDDFMNALSASGAIEGGTCSGTSDFAKRRILTRIFKGNAEIIEGKLHRMCDHVARMDNKRLTACEPACHFIVS